MAKKFIPSVTRILKDLGYIDLSGIPIEALETKRQLGIDVHAICARLARGQKIDLDQYQGPIRDRAERFIGCLEFMKARPISVEQRISLGGEWPFSGQHDLIVWISGLNYIWDLKPIFHHWQGLQLAGYRELAIYGKNIPIHGTAVIPLDSSRNPSPVMCDKRGEDMEWDRCLKSWWWRYRNGLIRETSGSRS